MASTLLLAADEDFDQRIVRGARLRTPDLNIVTVQEAGLAGLEDPDILEWAATENRVLLTHDVNTMTAHAYKRIADGLKMTGVAAMNRFHSIGELIDEILLIAECSEPAEWINRVAFLPL